MVRFGRGLGAYGPQESSQEIAAIFSLFDCPAGIVKSRLRHARKLLKA
jgi:DNA-directed RNA polymerase specialized sigma24 family protein